MKSCGRTNLISKIFAVNFIFIINSNNKYFFLQESMNEETKLYLNAKKTRNLHLYTISATLILIIVLLYGIGILTIY